MDFFKRHREQPFFFYYPTHLIHNPIVRTPDSKPDTTDPDALYEDNVAYLDKEVGQLVAALERLGLRERTVIVFRRRQWHGQVWAGERDDRRTADQRHESQHARRRQPRAAHRELERHDRGKPRVRDLVDFTDFLPTFAELGGARRRPA